MKGSRAFYRSRNLTDASSLKQELEREVQLAEDAGYVTDGLKSPFWSKVVRPLIQTQVSHFYRSVLDMDPAMFHGEQLSAKRFRGVLEYVRSLDGTREEHLKKARELQARLEELERGGMIPIERDGKDG